jgi:hypothetical protein
MAKLTICAAFLLAAVGGSYAADAWAADDMPTKARIASSLDVPRRGCHCLTRMFPVVSSECSQISSLVDPLGTSIVEVTGCEA